MFTYRQLILAMIVSSTKIIFADILVQPGYEHQFNNNPSYSQYQPVQHDKMSSANEQYAKQLAAQYLKQHLSEIKAVQSYYVPELYQHKVPSNLIGYPLHYYPYHHHYMPKRPSGKMHYVKLGGQERIRPSVFIGYPNPLAVHYRRKRSTDSTNVKLNELATATYDVATKPPLIDIKYPTVIDSLLPENESNNTNDKHVKNRQSNFATKPFLFGLDPSKMYSTLQTKNLDEKKDETEHSISKRQHVSLITPVFLTQQSTPDSTKTTITEPTQQTLSISREKEENQKTSQINQKNLHPTFNVPSTKELSSSLMTKASSPEEKSDDDYETLYFKSYPAPLYNLQYWAGFPPIAFWPWHDKDNSKTEKKIPISKLNEMPNPAHPRGTTNDKIIMIPLNRMDKTKVYLSPNGVTYHMNRDIVKPTPSTPTIPVQYKNHEDSSNGEIIGAANSNTPRGFYTTSNDFTKDYPDNIESSYRDYEKKPIYLTDGFRIYVLENNAHSSNIPSKKVHDYTYYKNINSQSNIVPMTYAVSTLPRFSNAYYYPKVPKKLYIPHKSQRYGYYKNFFNRIHPNNPNVPPVFYRWMYSPHIYY